MRPSYGMMNSQQQIDGSAHFVRGRQRDDHRPNRKRLIAIPLPAFRTKTWQFSSIQFNSVQFNLQHS